LTFTPELCGRGASHLVADPGGVAFAVRVGRWPGGGEAEVEPDLAPANRGGIGVGPGDRAAHGPAADLREGRGVHLEPLDQDVDDVEDRFPT
jgi:hypothetical protein